MYSGDEFYDDETTSGRERWEQPESCPICRMVRYGITPNQEATAARLATTDSLCENHDLMRVMERAPL